MSTSEELQDVSKIYRKTSTEVYDEHDALRIKRDKLKKKQDRITAQIGALDRQATLLWEVAGLYSTLGMATETGSKKQLAEELTGFSERFTEGDDSVEYMHVERESNDYGF